MLVGSRTLAWASQDLCDSDNTCWMNSVPMSCSPACPIRAGRPRRLRCGGRRPRLEDHRDPQLAVYLGRSTPQMGAQPCVGAPRGRSPLMELKWALPERLGCLQSTPAEHVCMYACVHVCLCVCEHVRMCACVHMCNVCMCGCGRVGAHRMHYTVPYAAAQKVAWWGQWHR